MTWEVTCEKVEEPKSGSAFIPCVKVIMGSATVCTAKSSGSEARFWRFPKSGTHGTLGLEPRSKFPRFRF